jgi:hypothetical protein
LWPPDFLSDNSEIETSILLTQSDKELLHKKVLFYYQAKLSLLITTILDKTFDDFPIFEDFKEEVSALHSNLIA